MSSGSEQQVPTAFVCLGDERLRCVDLPAVLGPRWQQFPYVLRILADNIARTSPADTREAALAAVRDWLGQRTSTAEVDVRPGRLLMHDTTSTPALVDMAAMRDAVADAGGDPARVAPSLPVDVSIDHSLAVEAYGHAGAVEENMRLELRRNAERYRFLKWAGQAMPTVHLNVPGTGIMHTINMEQLATVAVRCPGPDGSPWIAPDFMLGTDSHTPMVNGMGVLAWGIGGLEAEMVMLGLPCTIRLPEVVGVRLVGELPERTTATDLALVVTHRLRSFGVSGSMVEFFGPGAGGLSVGQRAVVANMAPEYGATTGFFAPDDKTIGYLRMVAAGRVDPALVEAYCRRSGIWSDQTGEACYTHVVEIDLDALEPSVAGPARPQDLLPAAAVGQHLTANPSAPAGGLPRHPVAIAAITSCTNTSDPALLIAAGLLARNARRAGLTVPAWVKTSLAPGSPAAEIYLGRAGLLPELEQLGFGIVGFGCTTCIGNSGPLPAPVEAARREGRVEPVAILSGNRNFPGRVNPDISQAFIASPPLVVAYALLGDAELDVTSAPLGLDSGGSPVTLADIWPDPAEVEAVTRTCVRPEDFPAAFARRQQWDAWETVPAPGQPTYPWQDGSTILRRPPFVALTGTLLGTYVASPLLVLGDDITTDLISPASAIPPHSPVADFLVARGEARDDLNVFASRRGNWEVMGRGAFYAAAVRNELAPAAGIGMTRCADGVERTLWDAADWYRSQGRPTVVIAGDRYGMGSSRDWAAKAQWLLGVRAVLASSFERIHRSNLIGMGILPLVLPAQDRARMGVIDSADQFEVSCPPGTVVPRGRVCVRVSRADGSATDLELQLAVETEAECQLLRAGGAIPLMLSRLVAA